ncbi:MAG: GAF domain-containing protein [Proteobacteria bacterium]|nr:GAF domain-containing protein [Pseudomonadota bacterium]MCP4919234.1 GAF domain-containing protein [Pseudomonadota bacterium]
MATFQIESGETRHQVEAANWMAALGDGLGRFGLSEGDLSRVICDLDPSGTISVREPVSGRSFVISEVKAGPGGVQLQVGGGTRVEDAAPSVTPRLASEAWSLDEDMDSGLFDAPDPKASPAFETLADESGDAIVALLEAAAVLSESETSESACLKALELAAGTIPAESGCVLLLTPAGDELVFVAATGPKADSVRGMKIPADKGLAGLAVTSRTALLLREVTNDPRHNPDVDAKSGYRTQAILVVPLRGATGVHGCLELLNPFGVSEFEDWHLEAAQMLGASLASRLG